MTWTKQPPKDEGHYWHRDNANGITVMNGPDERGRWLMVGWDASIEPAEIASNGGEWWDQRIPEPPASEENAPEDWGHEDCEVCDAARKIKGEPPA